MSIEHEGSNFSISVSSYFEVAIDKYESPYFLINQNFPMSTLNLTVFVISNISVIIVNILVLIWLKVGKKLYFQSGQFNFDSIFMDAFQKKFVTNVTLGSRGSMLHCTYNVVPFQAILSHFAKKFWVKNGGVPQYPNT